MTFSVQHDHDHPAEPSVRKGWFGILLIVCLPLAALAQTFPGVMSPLDYAGDLVMLGNAISTSSPQIAIDAYQQAVEIFQRFDRKDAELNTLLWLGKLVLKEQPATAIPIFQAAYSLAQELAEPLSEGVSLKGIGDSYRRQHLLMKVLDNYDLAETAFTRAHQKNPAETEAIGHQISILTSKGNTYVDLSQMHQAIQFYERALQLLAEQPGAHQNRRLSAEILRDYSTACMRLGQYEQGIGQANKALEMFEEVHDPINIARVYTILGGMYEAIGQEHPVSFLHALGMYKTAWDHYQNIQGEARDKAIVLNNIGRTIDLFGQDETARNAFERPLQHQALPYFDQALTLCETFHFETLQSRVLNNIGEALLHLSLKEASPAYLTQAMKAFEQALSIQRRFQDRWRMWVTLSNLGRCYELQGGFEQAIAYSQEAVDVFEEIIAAAGIEEFKLSLRDQADATYQRLVQLSMHAGNHEQAFYFSERARARVLLDQLSNVRLNTADDVDPQLIEQKSRLQLEIADVQQLLAEQPVNEGQQLLEEKQQALMQVLQQIKLQNPSYAALTHVEPARLQDVQRQLDDQTTLLSYFVTEEETFAFVISHDTFQAVTLAVGRNALVQHISATRRFVRPEEPLADAFNELYTLLIRPLQSYLKTPVLGVLPHDVLHYLPFAALTDGQRFLNDDYTLFVLPHTSALQFVRKDQAVQSLTALALTYNKGTGLKELTSTDLEGYVLARLYPTRLFTRQQATKSVFKQFAGQSSLIHLATHAALNPAYPMLSELYLTPEHNPSAELSGTDDHSDSLAVHEIYELRLPQTDLVVLSACETVLGKRSRGDDIVGLTHAFLATGVSSVVASLWKVDDLTTMQFMNTFYLQLKSGQRKADALRAAQRITRVWYPHPYYWAGFVLTGDPGR